MTRIKYLAFSIVVATTATAVQAEGRLSLGAGVGIVQHPYKHYDADVFPFPSINYEGDNFWFRGVGGGYYLWNDTTDKLSITAYWSPIFFKPEDSANNQLRKLDRRQTTMMAGLSYIHNTEYGYLRTTLAGDTLDKSNGIVWNMAWLYRYTHGGLTVTPGIGVEWNSENQNQYYYGISKSEAQRSGLRSYNPESAWNPYLELSANYRFAGDWSLYGAARYTRLADEVTESPMVDKSWSGLISTGISYTF